MQSKDKNLIKDKNLTNELNRVYEWTDPISGNRITHHIHKPISLCVGKTTHRVTDSNGLVHCVPSVGYFGCVVCWEGTRRLKAKEEPVDIEE